MSFCQNNNLARHITNALFLYHVSDGMVLMKDLRLSLQSGLPNEDVRTNVALNLEGI